MKKIDELVLAAQHGDHSAFEQLLRPLLGSWFRFLLRKIRNEADAEDLLQGACVIVWKCLPGFRGEASFPCWAGAVLRSTVANFYRQSWVRHADLSGRVDLDRIADEKPVTLDDDEKALVRHAVEGLKPEYRAVIEAHYFNGKSCANIAATTSATEASVCMNLFRARGVLRNVLSSEFGSF
jgi:RNA polymerase sigma-70 factor (ECF subfamily)